MNKIKDICVKKFLEDKGLLIVLTSGEKIYEVRVGNMKAIAYFNPFCKVLIYHHE